jgi:predicted nucleotidyltransferase
LEQLYEKHFDPDNPNAFDIELALAEADLRDWQKEDVKIALFVEAHFGDRVIAIPDTSSYESYDEMQDFIATIEDDRLYNRLLEATQGRGAFGRFKAILGQHLAEHQRWHAFQENLQRERILEWLEEVGIEPFEVPQPVEVKVEDLLELRHKLLDEVFIFVQAASRIPGVTRMALIGSLTTDKVDPKDADVLVNVTDHADLKEVATLGRKLQGHAQSFGRSGEVFLADEQHHYLGRTCPWKQCGPGVRASCDALHCGQRPYLHDDLGEIKLPEALVSKPPLELWPEVVARVPLPEDVVEKVTRRLQANIGVNMPAPGAAGYKRGKL